MTSSFQTNKRSVHLTLLNVISQTSNLINLCDIIICFVIIFLDMACNITTKSGQCKGLEDILESTVKGKLQGKHGVWIDITYYLIFKINGDDI